MTKPARFTQAEIDQAKALAENAGLRLAGIEKRPDGTVKLEFGELSALNDDWRSGTAYERAS